MRAAARLTSIVRGGTVVGALSLVAACSPLLGIEDPVPARIDGGVVDTPVIDDGGPDGPVIDGAIDAPPAGDSLKLTITDFKLAKQQLVRFHVLLVHAAGGTDDVTATASYRTDQPTLVAFGAKGTVSGTATGRATITASLAGAAPVSVTATVTGINCHPVINEFATQLSTGDDEFIEVYNPCTVAINVTGWTLDYRAANAIATQPDSHLLVTLDGMMAPGALRVYGGSDYAGANLGTWLPGFGMAKNDGSIGLRSGPADTGSTDTGALVDSVGYGSALAGNPFIESKAMAAMAPGMSGSRVPFDGKDDDPVGTNDGDNSADFAVIATLTPGALNTP